MKLFIISDVHGSKHYLDLAIKAFNETKADKLVCLGDFYYHGPRNPLTEQYNPMEVANVFNKIKHKLVAIKGNCDAEVDQMISEFTFVDNYSIRIGNKNVYFHHGHKEIENINNYDVVFFGHIHTGLINKEGNLIYANPGSISLPKAEKSRGYMIIDENGIKHFDLISHELLRKIDF